MPPLLPYTRIASQPAQCGANRETKLGITVLICFLFLEQFPPRHWIERGRNSVMSQREGGEQLRLLIYFIAGKVVLCL
jgi:hypothetical protein